MINDQLKKSCKAAFIKQLYFCDMKFQIGDRVLIVHSGEEGTVVDEINDEMLMVEVNGISFPVYMDQIDHPYFKRFTEKKTGEPTKPVKRSIEDIKPEKKTVFAPNAEEGMWLFLMPVFDKDVFDDNQVKYFRVYLLNKTSATVNFYYDLLYAGHSEFNLKNEIVPFAEFYLHDVPMEDLNDAPRFNFEFSLQDHPKDKSDYFETSVKIKPKQLFQKISELLRKQELGFSYELYKDYPNKLLEEELFHSIEIPVTYKPVEANVFRQHMEAPKTVIDLHIEKLSGDHFRLSNGEKLSLQLRTFEKYYDLAVHHYQSSLIVIHGIGSGKLRDEIHDILRRKVEVKSFVNEYHPSFGYGATEIYFK